MLTKITRNLSDLSYVIDDMRIRGYTLIDVEVTGENHKTVWDSENKVKVWWDSLDREEKKSRLNFKDWYWLTESEQEIVTAHYNSIMGFD